MKPGPFLNWRQREYAVTGGLIQPWFTA
jgi:hypothetical protein